MHFVRLSEADGWAPVHLAIAVDDDGSENQWPFPMW